jgi:hypothetical protein
VECCHVGALFIHESIGVDIGGVDARARRPAANASLNPQPKLGVAIVRIAIYCIHALKY